jgi:DNA-directed RNA polymerase subunit M/transcription elongation factor TFIIS
MIAFPCPKCHAALKATEEKVGVLTKCPKCGSPVQVPAPPVATLVAVPATGDAPKKGEEKKGTSTLIKVLATVFGAVLAPILVAVVVKWADPSLWTKAQPTAQSPSTQGPTPTSKAIIPAQTLDLVTSKLSDNFYSFGWSEKLMKDTKNDDVDPNLFKYVSVPPSISVSSASKPAILETKRDDFENYKLHVDFKWGEKTYGDRETKKRVAQILLYATGVDGVFGQRPQGIFVDLGEGGIGSIGVSGPNIACNAKVNETPGTRRLSYAANGQVQKLVTGEGWSGAIYRAGVPEPKDPKENKAWDVKGWHPPGDPTKPGEVNKIMIHSHNGHIRVFVNNMVTPVNEITLLTLKKGRIGFTSNLADYTISKIEVEIPSH